VSHLRPNAEILSVRRLWRGESFSPNSPMPPLYFRGQCAPLRRRGQEHPDNENNKTGATGVQSRASGMSGRLIRQTEAAAPRERELPR